MPDTPEPWAFVLLALAGFRIWKLIAEDAILDRPRAWVLKRIEIDELVQCPWCSGWWIVVLWWGAWQIDGSWTLWAATPWALSAVVGAIAHFLEP